MDKYEKVFELAKRRGFLWNSFELYGGSRGFYDYGPLGSTLKRRIEQIWREFYVIQEGHMEIECPTIGIEDVFVASGHVGGFSDPLCECKKCGEAFRADHLVENVMEAAGTLSAEIRHVTDHANFEEAAEQIYRQVGDYWYLMDKVCRRVIERLEAEG